MLPLFVVRSVCVLATGATIPTVGYVYINYDPTQLESTHVDLSTLKLKPEINNQLIIYATNDDANQSFVDSNWGDDQNYWVQVMDDNKWVDCKIRIIKADNNNISVDDNEKLSDALKTTNSVFEIATTVDSEINWQTNYINIKPKTIATGSVGVQKLKFLGAKHGKNWIGKTNTFIVVSNSQQNYDSTKKFTNCFINQSKCTIQSISKIITTKSQKENNLLGIELISKDNDSLTRLEPEQQYLLELDKDNLINFNTGDEVVINNDSDKETVLSCLKPVILVGSTKLFNLISFENMNPQISSKNQEFSVYATNVSAIQDFEISTDTSDKKYSCSIAGGNAWSNCSIKTFDSSNKSFSKELGGNSSTKDSVFEIKLDKDIGVNWQTENIKIKQKYVNDGKLIKEETLKILFFQEGKMQSGKTKYFVGTASADKNGITGEGVCNINRINYQKCKIYDVVHSQANESRFTLLGKTLASETKPTSITAKSYLIEVDDMGVKKAYGNVKQIDFIFVLSPPAVPNVVVDEQPVFTEIKTAFYDETTKFLSFYTPNK